jgi:GT2 family glycosyltransferase
MIRGEFPQVQVITNAENLGFAKACNIGVLASKGDIILFLNSDVEFMASNPFEKVEQFFAAHPEIGIVGAQLIFPDGVPQAPGGKFISIWQVFKNQVLFLDSPLFHKLRHKIQTLKNSDYYEIDYVSGACFFVKRAVINEVGLLDESFFMYGEDMEYCYRAKQKDWRSAVLPDIEVVHLKSQSTKKNLENALYHGISNNCFLVEKFYGKPYAFAAHSIYAVGLFLRFLIAFVRKREKPLPYLRLFFKNIQLQLKLLTS